MKNAFILCKRNLINAVRDPVSLIFCAGFPAVMLILMELIFGGSTANGAEMFRIENFAPAIAVFGFSFTMLYTALTIAGDKRTAFMSRLNVTPVKPFEYLLSFLLSSVPVTVCQTVLFYAVSFIFGLPFTVNTLVSAVCLIPSALFFTVCGIFVGSVVGSDNQAGPVCSLFITASGLLGGIWMPISLIGGTFVDVCKCLHFYNGVLLAQNAAAGLSDGRLIKTAIVLAYTVVFGAIAAVVFNKKSRI